MNKKIFLGLDSGGSNTTCVLFDDSGYIIDTQYDKGSNIYVFKEKGIKIILNLIRYILDRNKLNTLDIFGFGLAIAGISDLNSRDLLLKELDRRNITKSTLLISDVEAAYRMLCPLKKGILVNVGTGIICFAKDHKGKIIKEAGQGYDKGDLGSGYWIGKELFSRILLNESVINEDNDLKQIFNIFKSKLKINTIEDLYENLEDKDRQFYFFSLLAEDAIDLAESGNDIALAIIQEATRYAAEYIIEICNKLKYDDNFLAINGSIIKNNFYRKLLKEALQFDIKNIHWISTELNPAFGAGLLVADYQSINISIEELIKGISIKD